MRGANEFRQRDPRVYALPRVTRVKNTDPAPLYSEGKRQRHRIFVKPPDALHRGASPVRSVWSDQTHRHSADKEKRKTGEGVTDFHGNHYSGLQRKSASENTDGTCHNSILPRDLGGASQISIAWLLPQCGVFAWVGRGGIRRENGSLLCLCHFCRWISFLRRSRRLTPFRISHSKIGHLFQFDGVLVDFRNCHKSEGFYW